MGKTYDANKSKLKFLEEQFNEFSNDGLKTISEFSIKFGLTDQQVRYRLKKFKIPFNKITQEKKIRNNKILELVEEDELTYEEIGKIFNLTKQRIKGIAHHHGYNRWSERKLKFSNKAEEILKDISNGLTYDELKIKHSISILNNLYGRGLLPNLFSKFKKTRDESIVDEYQTKIARKIIESDKFDLNNPNGIKTLSRVYKIASDKGFKRYPKIGNRSKGGTFEDKKILKYIQKKRDKDGWSFKKIADKLQRLGHKTLTGKEFDVPNVYYKYNAYKKNKYKRVSYD